MIQISQQNRKMQNMKKDFSNFKISANCSMKQKLIINQQSSPLNFTTFDMALLISAN